MRFRFQQNPGSDAHSHSNSYAFPFTHSGAFAEPSTFTQPDPGGL
jgi:hypothetical protein